MVPNLLPRDRVQPLLSTIGGKPRDGPAKPVKEPEDVNAPPIESSTDEEEEVVEVPGPLEDLFADSSDDGYHARSADIVPTKFGGNKASTKTATANNGRQFSSKGKKPVSESPDSTPKRRSARQPPLVRPTRKRSFGDVEDIEDHEPENASHKKAKAPGADKSFANVGGHMQPGWLLENSIGKKAKPQKAGYGKKASKPKPQLRFLSSESPGKPGPLQSLRYAHDFSPPRFSGKKLKNTTKLAMLDVEETTPKPGLKVLDNYQPRSDLGGFDMSIDETPADKKKRVLGPGQVFCPMCDEMVDAESLEAFSKGKRMTIARQTKFCLAHKKKAAQKVWDDNGYPDIDWEQLEKRVADHRSFVESLIRGASSHFGTLHEEKIETGKNRTIFKTEEYATPGYYGLRGMSVLTETIVETFSSLLRERAPSDKLISARGYTAYVQSVLVPELSVKLIQEDMGDISAEQARTIMQESRAIGELLNDERPESQPQRSTRGQVTQKDNNSPQKGDDEKKIFKKDVEIPIRTVADSDSELSSLDSPSMDDKSTSGTSKPGKLQMVEVEDSDSDLTSLDDL